MRFTTGKVCICEKCRQRAILHINSSQHSSSSGALRRTQTFGQKLRCRTRTMRGNTQRLAALSLVLALFCTTQCEAGTKNETAQTQQCVPTIPGKCAPGLLLPVWPTNGNESLSGGQATLRGAVYLGVLFYLFIGVAIVSDVFMAAIEVITSQERQVEIVDANGERRVVSKRVWNEAVANLTLMAVGTSCPEILLSAIEICKNGFVAGDLGPGTIVGSAAYNLFVIPAVCVAAVGLKPKRIQNLGVFFCTAAWSVFAYVWLYLILAQISPGEVELWEALVTLLGFPATALSTYLVDRAQSRTSESANLGEVDVTEPEMLQLAECAGQEEEQNGEEEHMGDGAEERTDAKVDTAAEAEGESVNPMLSQELIYSHRWAETLRKLHRTHPGVKLEELVQQAERRMLVQKKKSLAFYRMQSVANFTTGEDLLDVLAEQNSQLEELEEEEQHAEQVQFVDSRLRIARTGGELSVDVRRLGAGEGSLGVSYWTEDGSALAGDNYERAEGTLLFHSGETVKQLVVRVLESTFDEPERCFSVRVRLPQQAKDDEAVPSSISCTVTIAADDERDAFEFEREQVQCSEASGSVSLLVRRLGERESRIVYVPFRTVEESAVNGVDYIDVRGQLQFNADGKAANIDVQILNTEQYEKSKTFFVELGQPSIGERSEEELETSFGASDGSCLRLGAARRVAVVVHESEEFQDAADRLTALAQKPARIRRGMRWRRQFEQAICGGELDGVGGMVLHVFTLPLKLFAALAPPPAYAQGWLCFGVSLLLIGLLTALIGDVASHFGCSVGLRDAVTAITFVAVGTSVPDTFASRIASMAEQHADNAIGNVTGSSAVNVFLGIGLAWFLAAAYWTSKGLSFRVPPGSLGPAVALYCAFALLCIALLMLRRRLKAVGGELGGPALIKWASFAFMLFLWFAYILLSSLEIYCISPLR